MKAEAPYYVYEGKIIEDACECLRYALPGFDFLYSVKANPFGPVMELIAEQGFGADAASVLEVEMSRACGIPAEKIYYATPGKRSISNPDLNRELFHVIAGYAGPLFSAGPPSA